MKFYEKILPGFNLFKLFYVSTGIHPPKFGPVLQKAPSRRVFIIGVCAAGVAVLIVVFIVTIMIIRIHRRKLQPDNNELLPSDINQFSNEIYMERMDVPPRILTSDLDDMGAVGPIAEDDGLPYNNKIQEMFGKDEKITPYSTIKI